LIVSEQLFPRLDGRVVAICGGVGGAKLALGLQEILEERLTVIVNVGDDFRHLGLCISPDLDTVLYTLGGLSDEVRGWGRADETWNFMTSLKEVGGDTWFALGDRDLALHIERTRRVAAGESLSEFTHDIAVRFGLRSRILPVSDDSFRTIIETDAGELPFQRYFVEHRCQPAVRGIHFDRAQNARISNHVAKVLQPDGLRMIVLCPSNPYLSIDPILAVPGMRDAVRSSGVPVIAVAPIISGQAIKGPTAKIMAELGVPATVEAIVSHYKSILSGLIVDTADELELDRIDLATKATPTLMTDLPSKISLARHVLAFGEFLAARLIERHGKSGGG
jgi:LPPG:FO 2-phospho-L-lactate transferase